ncbi:MAG TPA: response regulator [Polyangia bacterium]|nr:response regulator [Polyangia bacterium]
MSDVIDILLVDDEARNLDVLEAILADPGYRLLRAQDADRALRLLLENDVAAIVLDIKMPGVSGLELAQIIKNTKRFRQTPIVFLTAYLIEDQHVIAGYDAGAVDYLTKPVNAQILRHKVAVFAELFRKTRELAELNEKLEERVKERTAELERSETELRQAAQQKDEFLAVLAHELRNPLAPLRTGLDLLLRRKEPGPAMDRTLALMDRQLVHMVRLIDDLLDISRISRGALELKKETIDLGLLVESTIESCRAMFEQRDQRLSLHLTPDLEVVADPTRVTQMITNLLTNAAKFTPRQGQITVDLAGEPGQAVIRVADSGVGIPADQIDRIFNMFVRIDRSTNPTEPGLGIGLALSRRLAEMHGGSLTAASPGAGRGATLSLSLPATTRVQEAPSDWVRDPIVPVDPEARLKVLVIEDNEDIAETLTMLLEQLGHHVWLARTGPTGIHLVEEAQPNVVLCDLGLPVMDGLEVCRKIRALPVATQPTMVAVTGWGQDEDRRRTREAGFNHHLVKPVELENLSKVLQTVRAG